MIVMRSLMRGWFGRDVEWRVAVLRSAGLSRREARAIASQPDVDVHEVVSLLERGCSVHLALRIAAEDRLTA
jgi:hypothetical protein